MPFLILVLFAGRAPMLSFRLRNWNVARAFMVVNDKI